MLNREYMRLTVSKRSARPRWKDIFSWSLPMGLIRNEFAWRRVQCYCWHARLQKRLLGVVLCRIASPVGRHRIDRVSLVHRLIGKVGNYSTETSIVANYKHFSGRGIKQTVGVDITDDSCWWNALLRRRLLVKRVLSIFFISPPSKASETDFSFSVSCLFSSGNVETVFYETDEAADAKIRATVT